MASLDHNESIPLIVTSLGYPLLIVEYSLMCPIMPSIWFKNDHKENMKFYIIIANIPDSYFPLQKHGANLLFSFYCWSIIA